MSKRKLKKAGDICRHCDTPTYIKKSKFTKIKLTKKFYFNAYLKCPNCKAIYMLEEYKVFNKNPLPKLKKKKKLKKNQGAKKLRRLQPSEYNDYINSKAWQKKRKEVLAERPFCFCCNDKANHIHHRTYARLGIEKLEDLIALCANCHSEVHNLIENERCATLKNSHKIYKQILRLK